MVFSAVIVSAMHWQDLTQDITDRILTPQNLILLWLLFPMVKLLHEFGHAAAVKVCGGEVHDLGIMFLMLQPVPYVDASSAWAFADKWQRILVGAGGMLAELFLAALAFFVWLSVEPGTVRAVAYNIIFICGVTTVLFNANPLMRYDGYYMLTDYLEMPNLRTRANGYLRYLVERYLIGCRDEAGETFSVTESLWFALYPVASFIYRIFIVAAIALFLAGKFLLLGVVVALSGLFGSVLIPLAKGGVELYNLTRRAVARGRAIAGRAAAIACLMVAAVWLPLPLRTHAEGVVWIPDDSYVRASVDGFIQRIVAQPGTWVHRGDLLVVCEDAQAEKEVKVLEFRLDELKTRYAAQWLEDIKQAQIIKDEIAHVEQRLARARERLTDLTILARADGVFILPDAQNLAGRLIQQGGRLGYVLDFATLTARVVVTQVDVDLVRERTRGVEARLAERPSERLVAVVKREVPAASEELPSTALGSQGGGAQAVDPVDRRGVKAMEKLFQLELGLPSPGKLVNVGGRVYVRFDHGWEPLVFRYVRRLQQLFLTKIYA